MYVCRAQVERRVKCSQKYDTSDVFEIKQRKGSLTGKGEKQVASRGSRQIVASLFGKNLPFEAI